jgi:threonine aldolase
MATCELGDDVYGDDPTVNRLETLAAETLGKEAALFLPSGTMGNQLSIMTHTRRGDEIMVSHQAHIVQHEVGAAAVLSGVSYHIIKNNDGIIHPHDVEKNISADEIHCPHTGLVCMENALSNGHTVSLKIMEGVYKAAKFMGVPVHLDGARIFNAAAALGVNAAEIAKHADSVMFCLSKGLCAPVGSMVCGDKAFIEKARKNRKLLGGGMRQAGVLAACGIVAIEKLAKRLHTVHSAARYLASRLTTVDYVEIDPTRVIINLVFFRISKKDFNHAGFVRYLLKNGVKINPSEQGEYRFVTHNDISEKETDRVIKIMKDWENNGGN